MTNVHLSVLACEQYIWALRARSYIFSCFTPYICVTFSAKQYIGLKSGLNAHYVRERRLVSVICRPRGNLQ